MKYTMRLLIIVLFLLPVFGSSAQSLERIDDTSLIQPVVPIDSVESVISTKGIETLEEEMPLILFDRQVADFGKLVFGEKMTCIFRFTNRSLQNIMIDGIQANTCIEWEASKGTIEPGAMGYVLVTYKSDLDATVENNDETVVIGFKTKNAKHIIYETLLAKSVVDYTEFYAKSAPVSTTTSY
jgi:hypothetical protein